jgi:hypothetical protein
VLQKRMFKVITPMEGRDGAKWWLRCGTGFTNKDESINMYLNCLPLGKGEITLQLRELTEEDLRSRDDKRAQSASARAAAAPAQQALDAVPF